MLHCQIPVDNLSWYGNWEARMMGNVTAKEGFSIMQSNEKTTQSFEKNVG